MVGYLLILNDFSIPMEIHGKCKQMVNSILKPTDILGDLTDAEIAEIMDAHQRELAEALRRQDRERDERMEALRKKLAERRRKREAELKAKAMSLGRGYVLSQVKLVEDSAWKFSSGGKLLRNVVPCFKSME